MTNNISSFIINFIIFFNDLFFSFNTLISSGYSQTARFKTYSQFSLDYTANCPERPKFAKLERIIDGKNKKQSAEFTLFVEAAHRLGINLNAVGHIE